MTEDQEQLAAEVEADIEGRLRVCPRCEAAKILWVKPPKWTWVDCDTCGVSWSVGE